MTQLRAGGGTLFIAVLFCLFSLANQTQKLDGIVAVVGDEIILQSDLDAYVALRLGGLNVTPDTADLPKYRKQFLGELIDGKILLVHAKNDTTVAVSEEEVDRALENHIGSILRQSNISIDSLDMLLRKEQGISLAKFKAEARSAIREQQLKQKVQQMYLSSIKVSRRDVESFYVKYHDSLPLAGKSVLLSKLAVEISPPAAVRQAAYDKILSIKQRLDGGADFADMAKKFSESPEASDGGDLGFIEKGSTNLLSFEEKAFSLAVGQTSEPIETMLGFHIVNVMAKQNQQVHVRQIFIKVVPPPDLVKKNIALLDSVRPACKSEIDFIAAVRKFSTDNISKVRDGRLGWKLLLELPAQVRGAVDSLPKGGISTTINDNKELAIYFVVDKVESRPLTLDDDWQVLADKAKDIMAQKKLIDLVTRWRQQVYINIRI